MSRAIVIEGTIREIGSWVYFHTFGGTTGYVFSCRHAVENGYEEDTEVMVTLVAPRTYTVTEFDGTESTIYLSKTPPRDPWDFERPVVPTVTRRQGEEEARRWRE